MYLIDTKEARSRMMSEVKKVKRSIVDHFHQYMLDNNTFVQGYKTMMEMMEEEKA